MLSMLQAAMMQTDTMGPNRVTVTAAGRAEARVMLRRKKDDN